MMSRSQFDALEEPVLVGTPALVKPYLEKWSGLRFAVLGETEYMRQ